jgi:squalene-hopene/tetraprenyl-beta-curcumene cyclase
MRIAMLVVACFIAADIWAEDLTLENVTKLPVNSTNEPTAQEFSLAKAVEFLDHAALDWTRRRKCFTCHTNFAYLMARPMVDSNVIPHQQVRSQLETLVKTRWQNEGPRWDAEVVMTAAVLSINDSLTTNQLSPEARTALDRMWTLQRDDGGFDWLKCDWPPMEIDDDYGIAIAAMAVGAAPEAYAKTESAQRGLAKLRQYLQANPPPTLHHHAMLVWAESYGSRLLTDKQRETTIRQLSGLQKEDGGWSAATLADWKRADESDQDVDHSDAYGTAFAVFVLQRSGVSAQNAAIEKGIDWLKGNQRQSGRWFSRSLYKDSTHYLSHAASAMAVMAIQSADQER